MKVRLTTDDGSEELVVPAALIEQLSAADEDDETNAAAVVGDLAMVAVAQQAKRLADHDHGGQDRDPEEVKVLAMELFEERFGRSYAEIAGTANGAEEQVDPDSDDPSTSDEEQVDPDAGGPSASNEEQVDIDAGDPSTGDEE
jgi:hypothetical protein